MILGVVDGEFTIGLFVAYILMWKFYCRTRRKPGSVASSVQRRLLALLEWVVENV